MFIRGQVLTVILSGQCGNTPPAALHLNMVFLARDLISIYLGEAHKHSWISSKEVGRQNLLMLCQLTNQLS